ncbi:PIG-L family deacetylase [Arsenicicoccus dermatophilus]|uniref:PIG-L family deacetylase n=1 Tax=Arsenicicoccus dermatophilus TaxID=1076331 RepID=UPI001F4CFCC2|nr:PIG-L family deacetylase [Arsenicicoccus dermatophilus]MCH8614019.1 PIG-L family deacetylase [Arsenicicoccus dermatophilus]
MSGPNAPGPWLVVAPHLDDAVLSCGWLVARADPVDVLTVCTGRPAPAVVRGWDRACGWRDSDEAMAGRLAEDEAAFAGTPHRRHLLGLLDQQYVDGERSSTDARLLTGWVARWLDARPEGVALVPAATGWVPPDDPDALGARCPERDVPGVNGDHRWVRDTVIAGLADTHAGRVGIYEDLPYLWGRPGADEVARLPLPLVPHEVPVDRRTKAHRIAAYASQLDLLTHEGRRLDDPDVLPPTERCWLPT